MNNTFRRHIGPSSADQLNLFYTLDIFKNKDSRQESAFGTYAKKTGLRNLLFEIGSLQVHSVKKAIGEMHRPDYLEPKWRDIEANMRGENIKNEKKMPTANALADLIRFIEGKKANGEDGKNVAFLETSVEVLSLIKKLDECLVLDDYERYGKIIDKINQSPEESAEGYVALRIDMHNRAQRNH